MQKSIAIFGYGACNTNISTIITLDSDYQINCTGSICKIGGHFNISSVVPGPLDFLVNIDECLDYSFKNCTKFNKITINQLCSKMADEKSVWSPFFNYIEPRMTCPLQVVCFKISIFLAIFYDIFLIIQGRYELVAAQIDFGTATRLSDPRKCTLYLKLYSGTTKKGNRIEILCIKINLEISEKKRNKKIKTN